MRRCPNSIRMQWTKSYSLQEAPESLSELNPDAIDKAQSGSPPLQQTKGRRLSVRVAFYIESYLIQVLLFILHLERGGLYDHYSFLRWNYYQKKLMFQKPQFATHNLLDFLANTMTSKFQYLLQRFLRY